MTPKFVVKLTTEAERQYKNLANIGGVLHEQARKALQVLEEDPYPDGERKTRMPYPYDDEYLIKVGFVDVMYLIFEEDREVWITRFTQKLAL